MQIDFSKIIFQEIDNDEYPTQIFYYWDIDSDTIREFIDYYDSLDEEIDKKFNVKTELTASFCLVIFSQNNFKLELIVNDEAGNQIWIEACKEFYAAHEWIELIPNYGKLRIRIPQEDDERVVDYYKCDNCGFAFIYEEYGNNTGNCPKCGSNKTNFEELTLKEVWRYEQCL